MKLLKLFLIFIFVFIVFVGLERKIVKAQTQSGESASQSKEQKSFSRDTVKEKKEITEQTPLVEIKRLEKEEPKYSIELRKVPLQDFFRLVAHDYDLNIIVDQKVEGEITASLTNVSLKEALDIIVKQEGLVFKKKGKIIIVEPSLITKIIPLKNTTVSSVLEEDYDKTSKGKNDSDGAQTVKAQTSSKVSQLIAERGSKGDIYDLLSSYGKIIPNKSTNSLVVIDYPNYVKKVEDFVNLIDQKLTTRVFKINHISVKQLFPELLDKERDERKLQREEREAEREEIEGIKKSE